MRYLITKKNKIIDLEDKSVSSYEYVDKKTAEKEHGEEEAFYNVYYYDSGKGKRVEKDGKGGSSVDCFKKSEIVFTCDTIEEVMEYKNVTIPYEEYKKLKQDSEELKQCKETIAKKENLIKRLITPYVEAKVSEYVFEQISNNKFVQNKVVVREHVMYPDCVEVVNSMLVRKVGNE